MGCYIGPVLDDDNLPFTSPYVIDIKVNNLVFPLSFCIKKKIPIEFAPESFESWWGVAFRAPSQSIEFGEV